MTTAWIAPPRNQRQSSGNSDVVDGIPAGVPRQSRLHPRLSLHPEEVIMSRFTRRAFLNTAAVAPTALAARWQQPDATRVDSLFPTQAPDIVREVVGVSHRDLVRLRQLVDPRPALANATWDWGFGDWESALGAGSHVGNRDITEYLLSRGARPSIFSAAMLGQLAVVKAFVEAQPGVQRTKGPHGITLLAHARAGGAAAAPVVEFLKTLGDADQPLVASPLADADRDRLVGTYTFGGRADEKFDVTVNRATLWIQRPGGSSRGLIHRGGLEFSPVGTEAVRVRFTESAAETTLTILDPDPVVTARRSARLFAPPRPLR
jgi:hypothetical protein